MSKNRKIVLDTETTGLDYIMSDRIIELAAIELLDDKETGKEFHTYINPKIKIEESGQKIHGITDELVKDKPFFSDIAQDFLDFVGDSIIIAHNAEFDRCFLNLELGLLKRTSIKREQFIDSLALVKSLFRGEKASLDDLCLRFGIDTSSRQNHHGALIDSKLLAKVYINIISYINNNFGLDKKILKNLFNKEESKLNYKKQDFSYRSFELKEEEKEQHYAFLAKIKKPLWKK